MGGVVNAELLLIGAQIFHKRLSLHGRVGVFIAPGTVHGVQILRADGTFRIADNVALRFQEQLDVVGVLLHHLPVQLGPTALCELEVVLHQPQQSRHRPEKDALHFFTELFRKVGIIDSIRRLSLCCQDQLPAEEAVAAIIQGNQIAVGEGQDAGVHESLIALLALTLQIHFPLRRDNRFDVVRLLQRFQPHIVVDHQVNVFQVGTGERVFRNLSDASVLRVGAEHPGQHMADLALAFAAAALDHHHLLSGVAGNQAVPDEFLQCGNVLRPEKL